MQSSILAIMPKGLLPTGTKLTKNRQAINWLINNVLAIEWELGSETQSTSVELWKLGFVWCFLQLLMAINRFWQISQLLLLLLENIRAQLDMLSLVHLLPSIMAPVHLQDILIKSQN